MRNQTRTIESVIEGNCLAQPAPSPFTNFPGSITVDGTTFPMVGLHKKGFFGSLDTVKPSIKVDFGQYVSGQEYDGLSKLTLNNSKQDPSYVRQCLTYGVFAAAGVTVPRCNFAHVRVNGDDLGIFVNVETIDHKMTRRDYANGDGELYEGTLSDFRTDWVNTFDPKGGGDLAPLQPVVSALQLADDTQMMAALSAHLDVDRFLTYWAMEVITAHWDGYANDKNNFFVYDDPTSGLLQFIPWGVDATFQPGRTFGSFANASSGPNAVAASGMLANRLFSVPDTHDRFLARERSLLDSAWDEPHLHAEIDRMESLIGPIVDQVDGTAWRTAVDDVRSFVDARRGILTGELDAGPTWPYGLDGYPCLQVNAQVGGTFQTTFGSIGATNPWSTGGGTMTITVNGVATTLGPIGATSGVDPNGGASPDNLVEVFGQRSSDGHVIAAVFAVPPAWWSASTFDVGFVGAYGVVFDYDPATNTSTPIGNVLGSLSLGAAGGTGGATVSGTFSGHADSAGSPPLRMLVK
jgi:hypothetical protein